MAYAIYDYVNASGKNEFHEWLKHVDARQRAKLDSKIDMLEMSGAELPPNLLSPCDGPIKKIKVQGNPKLRPRLCAGPIDTGTEYTLLVGATERDMKDVPANLVQVAKARREEILKFGNDRRCTHVE
jgi:hypothetical protein